MGSTGFTVMAALVRMALEINRERITGIFGRMPVRDLDEADGMDGSWCAWGHRPGAYGERFREVAKRGTGRRQGRRRGSGCVRRR